MATATIDDLFAKSGLELRRESDDRWTGALTSGDRAHPLRIRRTANWLLFEVGPLGPAAPSDRKAELHRTLLAANRTLHLARYAIQASGEPVLLAELPTESLDPAELAAAITALRGALDLPASW